jgi:hypothetical protein
MNLNVYEVFALFYIPISLITWTTDFLSDKEIVHSELEIGIIHYLHYLVGVTQYALILILCSKNIVLTVLSIIASLGTQIGFLINKDYCWLLRLTNKKINPKKPNRKARFSLDSFIKHYIRGDSWAYSDIRNTDATTSAIIMNVLLIIHLIKIIMFNY